MAAKQGRRSSASGRSGHNSSRKKTNSSRHYTEQESALFHEVVLILLFAVSVILFLCNFGLIGKVGNVISNLLFGMFGFSAYVVSILIFFAVAFWSANTGNPTAIRKICAGCVLFFMVGVMSEMIFGRATQMDSYHIKELYSFASQNHTGGGVIAGSLTYFIYHFLDKIGTIVVVILLTMISIIMLTERSLVEGMKNSSRKVMELSREDALRRREQTKLRQTGFEEGKQRKEEERIAREEERRLRAERKENEKILRMDKRVAGVMADTTLTLSSEKKVRDDIHEITLNDTFTMEETPSQPVQQDIDLNHIRIRGATANPVNNHELFEDENKNYEMDANSKTPIIQKRPVARNSQEKPEQMDGTMEDDILNKEKKLPRKYIFPPLSRLQKGKSSSGDSARELKETAMRLQQTLNTFGVKVMITDISQGPAVTRYELQPEQGVKVSKIVGLADDIKLNLAATDIRIEAPIPGKAAIGIEVPNKENSLVSLRDLLERKEFKEFPSNLAFAVGKDIAGQVVVADIAKMPHMLIAGATGSGKSVCINTLIMSILYKAHPDDVKLIMVDPKVVELNVYNGIPHLMIPVVTDPKKAAAALHWGVSEMTDRYKKFADFNVRDLKGYNQKVESLQEKGGDDIPSKLPQIVIIVDELADLMMVAPSEVEESICRLAQLARAAGIHLIIATQRPSVDVITGLIKANMPSRVAFSVSSGVDSRTILDMNGAEKLLGKGDMLFYPQGYAKPIRIQGAFVSDREVSDVVDFLKNQAIGNVYAQDVEEKIVNMGTGNSASSSGTGNGNSVDEYFADAGKFIIDKEKASIGMLQRVFKIGFNRAARIMDQLCEYGVVGEEEGTKPRKVLMSMEQFDQLLEEI
ncbi:MAG TPA: DNA translocase FtsK [Lachnospiraceae bacterium]|nr:DNA translocase FtsK [Lachnospiraceae bacterium]